MGVKEPEPKVEDKGCPLMSFPIPVMGPLGQKGIATNLPPCAKEQCQFYVVVPQSMATIAPGWAECGVKVAIRKMLGLPLGAVKRS